MQKTVRKTATAKRVLTAVALATLWLAGAGAGLAADAPATPTKTAAGGSVADEHTVALWLFDETMYLNQALYDASDNWYNLNLQPYLKPETSDWRTDHNATMVPGRFGNAIARQLPGGAAADTRRELAFPYQSDWTWEFWLRATNAPSGTAFVFDTASVRERCSLEERGASWRLVSRNTGLDAAIPAGEGLFDNAWHHIAFVYRRGGTTLTYFVDGALRAQQAVAVSNAPSATSGRLVLLSRQDGPNPLWASLDEFRISGVGRYSANFVPATHSRNFGPNPPVKAAPTGPAPLAAQGVADLQGRKHLFIDGILLDSAGDGLSLRAHPPSPATYEVCMVATNGGSGPFVRDLPHERWPNGVVIWNCGGFMDYDGKVRYYYNQQTDPTKFGDPHKNSVWNLAISDDGLNFTRPNLGLIAYQGSKSNNIVFHGRQGTVTLDGNPKADPWARFKFTGWDIDSGLAVWSSPDGIHWTRNEVQQLPFATFGTVEHYWDDQTGTYKCYLRGESYWGIPKNNGTGREALLAETLEFFKPWPFQPIPKPSSRGTMERRWLPTPSLELHKAFITEFWPEVNLEVHPYRTVSHKYTGAPDVYVAFPWRFHPYAEHRNVALATSRDGRNWINWRLPWYVAAAQTFNGVLMKEALSLNGLIHREGELWQYAALKQAVHNASSPNDRLLRIRQRVDGFVSLSADAAASEATTREIRFAGRRLSLNARVRPGGSIRVALLNADGSPRAGFGLEDCDPIEGDFLRKAVTWKGKAEFSDKATVRLKLRLQNADLYALQFADQVVELTNGVPHLDGVSVSLRPVIAAQPADIGVMAGPTVTFRAAATGVAPLSYQWYKNDTLIAGATGTSYTTPTTTLNDNGAAFKIVVANGSGAATSRAVTLRVYAATPEIFVAPEGAGSNTEPYDTWAKAATNLATALAFAHVSAPCVKTVTVAHGTYETMTELAIATNIVVRSFGNGVYGGLANAAATIVKRSGAAGNIRVFNISGTGAVLDGFTIRDGYVTDNGSCGGGIAMSGGTLSNCIVRNNSTIGRSGGGGIQMNGRSAIVNCQILENRCGKEKYTGGGGILTSSSAVTIRNCLIAGNTSGGDGGGVYLDEGCLENCTIVNNTAGSTGGGVHRVGGNRGKVTNSIVYFNTAPGAAASQNLLSSTDAGLGYNCTPSTTNAGAGSISADPLFVNPAQGDYTLQATSPCIDKGSNQPWMDGATDLGGNRRVLDGDGDGGAVVDIGAYETGGKK